MFCRVSCHSYISILSALVLLNLIYNRLCLRTNELHLSVKDDKIVVYLINEKDKGSIRPELASAVQEHLTLTMTKVLKFYHKSFNLKTKAAGMDDFKSV
jgi:hypothetical protein